MAGKSKEPKVSRTIMMGPATLKAIDDYAKSKEESTNTMIQRAVQEFLERVGCPPKKGK